jgi:hypothetical protein
MTEAYRHDEIAKLAYELRERRGQARKQCADHTIPFYARNRRSAASHRFPGPILTACPSHKRAVAC